MQRERQISLIPLEQIRLGDNVRANLDPSSVRELAESIRSKGLIQPVTVQKRSDDEYFLVIGHRRFAAFQSLAAQNEERFQVIPALVVQSLAEDDIVELQLIENIQRENLSAHEIAQTLLHLKARGHSQKEIAARLGKSTGYIKNLFSAIRSIEASPELGALVAEYEAITLADIQEVRSLDKRLQLRLLKERARGDIKSIKELRERVTDLKQKTEESSARRSSSKKNIGSYSQVFRLGEDELSFLPAKIRLSSLSSEQRAELKDLLAAALAKLGV